MLENKADADFKLFAKVSDSVAKHCKFTLLPTEVQLQTGIPEESPCFLDANS